MVVATPGWKARVIRWVTRSPVNHAAILTATAGVLFEARPAGAGEVELAHYAGCRQWWASTPVTGLQRGRILAALPLYEGRPYGWLDVTAIGLDAVGIRWKWVTRRLHDPATVFCSQLVAEVFLAAAGVRLVPGKPAWTVTPGDLLDVIEHQPVPAYY